MKTVDHQAEREKLIEAAITAGAETGARSVTSQMIEHYSKSGRAYIYRYFLDKDDLIKKAFLRSDRNFFDNMEERMHFLINTDAQVNFKHRFRIFFDSAWEYSVRDLKYCKFYVSFYFSEMFDEECRKQHEINSRKTRDMLSLLLNLGENKENILHHMWLMILVYIMEISIGYASEEEYKERVFQMLYDFLCLYKKIDNSL